MVGQVRSVERLDDRRSRLRVRSRLPVSLELVLTREVEDRDGGHLRVGLAGDLEGYVEVRVSQDATGSGLCAPGSRVVWDQEVRLTRPLLRRTAALPPARWLLRANHGAMMRSARRRLAARRAPG